MLVAAYTRVSTAEQSEKGYSLGEQETRLKSYCTALGWTIYRTYTDGGYSGGNTDRPALQQMIQDIQNHRVQKVVVWKLDRLSRSQLDTLYLIEKVFLANGVDFVSMTENFDTATPFGKAMIGILAVFAQLERERIKERMMVGKTARAKSGRWQGGGHAPIGYDYQDGQLIVNSYEAMQVREAFQQYLSGVPVAQIERNFWEKGYTHKYGNWSGKAIHSVLANPIYTGQITFQKQTYPGTHEPIIDTETFSAVQARTAVLRQSASQSESVHSFLSGLIFCGKCGARYGPNIRRKNGKVYRYYSCYSRHRVSEIMARVDHCDNKIWRADDLDELVFDQIRQLALEPLQIAQKQPDNTDTLSALKRESERLERQINRLIDLYAVGNISVETIAKRSEILTRQKEAIDNQIEEQRSTSGIQPEQAVQLVQSFDDVLRCGSREEIRSVIVTLIDHLDLDGDNVTIYWNFSK